MINEPASATDRVATQDLPALHFQQVPLQVSYSTSEQPLTQFYVPLLARAREYRRLVGYFNARILARAAAGFAPFVARRGRWELVVGAQLSDEDVDAVPRGESLDAVLADRLCVEPLTEGVTIVEREHLRLLAWMLRERLLELRIGVPVDSLGQPLRPEQAHRYFHSKYGLLTDALGRQVAFSGSDNESIAGWTGNHEHLQALLVLERGRLAAVRRGYRPSPEPALGWNTRPGLDGHACTGGRATAACKHRSGELGTTGPGR